MDNVQSRREFLQFVSSQSITLGLSPLVLGAISGCASIDYEPAFKGLEPSKKDKLNLIPGLDYHLICKWGDKINNEGELFGFNNDFTSYFPIKSKTDEGLLWVNHESVIPQFLHNKSKHQLSRSINEIVKEQEAVGGSILHIRKQQGQWVVEKNSPYSKRFHGRTKIPFSHGHSIQGSKVAVGTIANCSGGQTPWNTVLTSEENYDGFYGEAYLHKGKRTTSNFEKFNWWKQFPLPPEHYGWVVEIDPFTGRAEKQILLGRAPHEGATCVSTKDNRIAVYMGEDREGGFIYKFVSDGPNFKSGTLYAADTVNGKWLPLDLEKSPILKTNFSTQLEVLTYAHQSAEMVGATPQDRPEDIEVHKVTGQVFIALTKNKNKGNLYGSVLKISEIGDHDAVRFESSTWVSGGINSGMACPDNITFDKKGNMWVTTDISEKDMSKPEYKTFGNNGLYYIPVSGKGAGIPVLVATAPTDAEFTGPWFTPDFKTLFLSVQHPGSSQRFNMAKQTSQWPDGPGKLPRSGVVAIQGSLFSQLMS